MDATPRMLDNGTNLRRAEEAASVAVQPTIEPDLPEPQKSYLLEEQKQRRAEIEKLIQRVESDQRNGLVITGLFWSWLAAQKIAGPLDQVIAALPPLLMLFFWARWWKLHRTIRDAAIYTMQLEKLFRLPALPAEFGRFGWETWLHDPDSGKRHRASLKELDFCWWMLLFTANVIIAVLYAWLEPALVGHV